MVSNKEPLLEIAENKLNPEFNSFGNCKQLYIPPTNLLSEEAMNYRVASGALCFDHLHLGNELIPLSQIDKVKCFPENVNARFFKLKVAHFNSNKWFATEMRPSDPSSQLPEHFKWYSNILVSRLRHKGMNIPEFAKNDENQQLTSMMHSVFVGGHIFKRSRYIKKW
jgi:hypothetical protein